MSDDEYFGHDSVKFSIMRRRALLSERRLKWSDFNRQNLIDFLEEISLLLAIEFFAPFYDT